ncbi:MAG: histidine kinase N-terminal 7TM domain-containing protein [Anaerolineales bacterium]
MNYEEIIYLLPYVASLCISLGVLWYVWTKRGAQGSIAFLWYIFGESLYILGYIFEISAPSVERKIFWESFQWLALTIPMIAFPVFVVQYTEYKIKYPRQIFTLSTVVPTLFSLLVLTDAWHHWIYLAPRVVPNALLSELIYDYSPVVVLFAIYSYILAFFCCALLFIRILDPHHLYRGQVIIISVGVLIPILGAIFSLMGVHLIPLRDASPLTTAISNIILAWGFYRFRIFEVVPIGRDKVFEAMVEPVVILDNKSNVVDINSSMLALLGKTAQEVVGGSAREIFDDFPIPIKMYMHVSYARAEATFNLGSKSIYYELTVWPLYNARKQMTGRIYISHDITALKELEQELRKLNTELEDRVRSRTSELAEAYDTTLEGWARALELRDKETEGHSRRVTKSTLMIARKLELPAEDIEHIRRGAILHDIGKMSIPDEILRKPGKLTDEERLIIQKHPQTAHDLLSPIPFLKKALEIPYSHHEKWDGTGYPMGLKGRDIPLSARIFAVADVWDALSSDRPYNKAWSREKIIAYFIEQSGKHFDPYIVNLFLGMVEKGEI